MRREVTTSASRNEKGQLETVSVNWQEEIPFIEQSMIMLATAGFIFGLLIVVFIPGWGLMLLLGGAVAFATSIVYPGRLRQVTFAADGQILTPHGYTRCDHDHIKGDHAFLTSIESRRMRDGEFYEVFVTSEYGSLFPLSTNLHEQTAFKVAVLLTRQLRELRAEQAARRAGEQSDTGVRDPDWGTVRGVLS